MLYGFVHLSLIYVKDFAVKLKLKKISKYVSDETQDGGSSLPWEFGVCDWERALGGVNIGQFPLS